MLAMHRPNGMGDGSSTAPPSTPTRSHALKTSRCVDPQPLASPPANGIVKPPRPKATRYNNTIILNVHSSDEERNAPASAMAAGSTLQEG